MKQTVAAVVLAAGASRRLGRPKQLVLQQDEPMVARAVRLAAEAGATPVIAVLGAEMERVASALAQSHCIVAENTQWALGMATSIHAGLRAIEIHAPQTVGVLILACDQPRLTTAHLRTMLSCFAAHNSDAIVASAYGGKAGVPALFPRRAFEALLALEGDQGARSLLKNAPCPVVTQTFDGGEIDIDTPNDLQLLT